ncbi:DNA polymerase I [Heyndrickxia sporothermodurans]|uniref:DNA polymerase I n=1 Tax=Heyndrickxia sporothermodurans TaxID=46224 RepID=A0AB37HFH3_9BACI|nr:DNA polymerase I [Heyndrickxia sporothermodurans]MBL5766304.1 DNA polymerase I [Heyndrickxia sporothermodurans]MBL5769743.1 DNA polymerase I [Heyndrickxia sporothermodurans]MBL5773444.1 DNA polymerase I [Heyndrickxia sporothermodurans]MBL5777601.1 DNA polymerase I [Heyndrickxia sporothermodurans]MBL5781187.1 DNA polymerase I [Heyndrickxia sporothermodurans]
MSNKLILIDGNSIAYRAFFALPLLNNEKGIHTNAIYGFTTMLMKILNEEKPTHILVAFDAGKTTFRHKTFKEYKGTRQKTPPELSEQFPFIRELLDAYGIQRYELANYEADDIIGTLSLKAEKEGFEVKVISGDKDLTQLSSKETTVCITKKGITDIEEYTPEHINEKYGLTPEQIIDMKGLMGDASDNIPGVPGIGEKTAIKLLKEFNTLENLLESIEHVSGKKLKEKLEEYKEQAIMSKQLATITREAPITIELNETKYKNENDEKLISLFKELGFNSLIDKLDVKTSLEQEEKMKDLPYEIVENITEELFTSESSLYVEILEDNYHTGEIIGFGMSNQNGTYFFPADEALKSPLFKNWAEDETKKKFVYDGKAAIVSLRRFGIDLKGIDFDLLIASYLLNPSENVDDFASVAKRHGFTDIQSDEQVYGKGVKQKVPEKKVLAEHVARKAVGISSVVDHCLKDLEENNQLQLFEELELPLSFILATMESTGIKVDVQRLKEMGEEILGRLQTIEAKIFDLAGEMFNINSPKQLGIILFEKLELPVIKKTKTGYSTSADVLEKLESKHEIVREILHYRQLGKLQSTYIEGLLKVVHSDNSRIHTRFNQVLAQTGRLSSVDPNLQNIPIRLEEGRKLRQAFIPTEKDWLIFSADYSQVELRVLAHIAGDEKLIAAFNENMDIHTKTAMDVFHVDKDDVTDNMRRQAKAVNFGIVYGISDYGLSQNLGITRKEAASFIERYFASYPGVKEYMNDIVQDAKEKGYVSTILKRRRYIPEITSRNFNIRSFAERTAMNTPIQGSAADIIKKAMIDMAARLKEEKLQTRLLLQVHDELIFEAPSDEIEILKKIVPEVMENAVDLVVPLKVDYAFGPTWFDAK